MQSQLLANGLQAWHLLVNASKTVIISFHHTNRPPARMPKITLHNNTLSVVSKHRHLGVIIQQNLRWENHIQYVLGKSLAKLRQFLRFRSTLNSEAINYLYRSYIRPILEYASTAYSSIPTVLSDKLERFQRKAARICLRLPLFSPVNHSLLLHHVNFATLSSRRKLKLALLARSIRFNYAPPHMLNISIPYSHTPYSLRHARTFTLPTTRTDRHRDSPIHAALYCYNQLPNDLLVNTQKNSFKSAVSPFLLSSICSCSDHPVVPF